MSLPTLIVVGAMKAGTTALHRYLAAHPDISMADAKEVNFFVGPEHPPADVDSDWLTGRWHRGLDWYESLFDAAKPVRGESSPAYTSPDQPEAPARIAATVPDVRLVYLARDPVERAVSQYAHHRRDGTEPRPVAEALLDPDSHYLQRSRHHERLLPYVERFAPEQLHVVVQERLLHDRRAELARIFAHVGADPTWWDPVLEQRWHVGDGHPPVPPSLRERFRDLVADDVAALRRVVGDDLPEWD